MRITTETRTCIKCGRLLPVGMFDDNWHSRTFVCKDCFRLSRLKQPGRLNLKSAAKVAREFGNG